MSDQMKLTRYLSDSLYVMTEDEVDDFDILEWWKKYSVAFPIMPKMARDILAIPISSVASEAAFSMGGCVLSPFRSSLTPRVVEALLCVEDWLRSSNCFIKDEEGDPETAIDKHYDDSDGEGTTKSWLRLLEVKCEF
ncbi:hypothetical protein SASPL_152326 [Salvia splendens]|uniref:HAT C-terminal dimerisation domain-containing protein n=1 Tax=Salvia splendens TaxID=180675 RepID=A0A8X8W319_SALSN|nr:hypothetical protein SASPL_152326 [Salvia splendens]